MWVAQRKSEVNGKNCYLKFGCINKVKVGRFQPLLYFFVLYRIKSDINATICSVFVDFRLCRQEVNIIFIFLCALVRFAEKANLFGGKEK